MRDRQPCEPGSFLDRMYAFRDRAYAPPRVRVDPDAEHAVDAITWTTAYIDIPPGTPKDNRHWDEPVSYVWDDEPRTSHAPRLIARLYGGGATYDIAPGIAEVDGRAYTQGGPVDDNSALAELLEGAGIHERSAAADIPSLQRKAEAINRASRRMLVQSYRPDDFPRSR